MIAKNEENHVLRIADNIKDAFDAVYITDTGSTDKTVELAKSVGWNVSHFTWINDFAAARNYSFKQAKEDYIMWCDMDDAISNIEEFKKWRDTVMNTANYFLATYNYAFDANRQPVCSFLRERVVKNNMGFEWKYFLHEGMPPISTQGPVQPQLIKTWTIEHLRTHEDMVKDKSRNLNIFESKKQTLDARMQYYYGKELFEAQKYEDAVKMLLKANEAKDLELHDRILSIQYAAFSLMALNKMEECMNVATMGLLLDPKRAEFFVLAGDSLLKRGKLQEAIPYYHAAINCKPSEKGMGVIFEHMDAYSVYPLNTLARIYVNLGDFENARLYAIRGCEKFKSQESEDILNEINRVEKKIFAYKTAKECDDIVITCPGNLYEWDEEVAKTKGVGGSEIAAIKMAKALKKLTDKRIVVFNQRETDSTMSGVEYVNINKMVDYFSDWKPRLHIAWRHNMKVTDAKTILWSHDLISPGFENHDIYDKYMVLSEFHKNYVTRLYGVPESKVYVTANGIDPERFKGLDTSKKNPNKIIYASSPDRGLDRAIAVCDLVRNSLPIELHIFYGFDNLRKMGGNLQADYYENLIKERPYIKYHGNVQQEKLLEHYKDAAVWLYPTNFLETYCITAIEMILSKVYPVVRDYGALPNTLAKYKNAGMASVIDRDCSSLDDVVVYAKEVIDAILNKKYDKIKEEAVNCSWENVAKQWIKDFYDNTI